MDNLMYKLKPCVELATFVRNLQRYGIDVEITRGQDPSPEAAMHDRGAPVPALIVSPRSEWGLSTTLRLLKSLNLYRRIPVSVRSGGHGYFNGASCTGVMLNLAGMHERRIEGNMLIMGPGCLLAHTVDILRRYGKAVPHGDCFGVGVGGHFLTAGWDLILARQYGLGCQSIMGGRVVLWDGSTVNVDSSTHPDLLYAMRGGAVAGAGVVSELRLRMVDEPNQATFCRMRMTKSQLDTCMANEAIFNAARLPREISVSFRLYFDADVTEPVCSLDIFSLLDVEETIRAISNHLGQSVASIIAHRTSWSEKALIDVRMLNASRNLAADPGMLAEATQSSLNNEPFLYWSQRVCAREMARSFFTSRSYWVQSHCESMLVELYEKFATVGEHPSRDRMYALIILGGGRMKELQADCSMPLGSTLARFELHWDEEDEAPWCRSFTQGICDIIARRQDTEPGRTYRGDIWKEGQDFDGNLSAIFKQYDRRFN